MREALKFLCGFSANQFLIHLAMATTGTQFRVFGITYGLGLNVLAFITWAVVSILSAYHAWVRPWQ